MRDVVCLLLCLLCAATNCCLGYSPPGKPVLLGCRSPEKETFTCWWQPGFSGGLTTTHRLFYQRERMEGTRECPDYHSAGENSCYFSKKHTSIWVEYYLTVVAANKLGNATSEVLKLDVMDIERTTVDEFTEDTTDMSLELATYHHCTLDCHMKPDAPLNVRAQVDAHKGSTSIHVTWDQPQNIDTKSGWVTLEYQLRVGQKDTHNWKEYKSWKQTHFTLYSVLTGAVYALQVRSRLDHGSWSKWSNATFVDVPNMHPSRGQPLRITVSVLAAIAFLAFFCFLFMKNVKQLLLPPVPGPKIRGVDVQLLKSGRYEDIVIALITHQSFPPLGSSEDQLDDYLVVSKSDGWPLPDTPECHRKDFTFPYQLCLEPAALTNLEKAQEHTRITDHSNQDVYVDGSWTDRTFQELKGLMDVQTQGDAQDHYSRVREVTGDSVIFLEETWDNHRTKHPHEPAACTVGVCSVAGGYVCAAPGGSST